MLDDKGIKAFAFALDDQRKREQGKKPKYYIKTATCQHCGPIWWWDIDDLLACPWCHNRETGKPIPRPFNVRCIDCIHFLRHATHPHLGNCAKGQPEGVVRNWDIDKRHCDWFVPIAH